MAKIIAICNQKGGTGKTTTAINLSTALAMSGQRVLLIDIDPQGNATSGLGIDKHSIKHSIYHVLIQNIPVEETILTSEIKNLSIVPSNLELTGAEIELVGYVARENRLNKALESIKDKFDFVIIDCPPSLGLLTLNSLMAAGSVIIPIQCEYYALEGVTLLLRTVNLVRERLNPNLQIEGVVLTMADFRTNLTNEVISEIKNYFKDKVYRSVIPRNIRLSEAPGFGKPILTYDRTSAGAKSYLDLAHELLGIKLPEDTNVPEQEKVKEELGG
ncbi:MAG: AAA family ATPase [Candidatus Omnitrophica bacterium]|nr:AAA family ATPase [Candidatus Omnitrophota bacterium]HOX54921.1 AAA family ATPase [Candidatus Omnitrophota bacterium]